MARERRTNTVCEQLELTSLQPLAEPGTLFGEGFSRPWAQFHNGTVSYTAVQQLLSMAEAALSAKQQAAEVLLAEVEQLQRSVDGDTLLQRVSFSSAAGVGVCYCTSLPQLLGGLFCLSGLTRFPVYAGSEGRGGLFCTPRAAPGLDANQSSCGAAAV
eukprot:GHUV01045805.1.p1 GENE.GHUV01045805.1~~GHUV01045805.1.p1  ORF type:complete len:158 (+),score=20.05 GHUV01045805.1:245-718(+)